MRLDQDSSRDSGAALSWHGSLVHDFNEHGDDDDPEERWDRLSSAMLPGGTSFEKGKWVRRGID